MLKLINTKLVIAILAALTAIGALLVRQHEQTQRAADEPERAAAILKQQQADQQAQKDREAALWKQAEENKKKHSSMNKGGSPTWQHYLP